jgi:hypothetical protein
MSPEIALLEEVWDTVKPYISKKEQVEIAEKILELFDENLGLDDIGVYKNDFDSAMKAALVSYFDEDEDYDEQEDYD